MRRNRVMEHHFPIQDQSQRRRWLIDFLIREEPRYSGFKIPNDEQGQKRLLRDLLAVRPAKHPGEEFLRIQDAYLQSRLSERESAPGLDPVSDQPVIYLRRGDLADLRCQAAVNSSSGDLAGCRSLRTLCVDTALQTGAGVELRLACKAAAERLGGHAPPGGAAITEGYNLPCRYVIHTVGPDVRGTEPSEEERKTLARCYRSCLELAASRGLASVAFPCLSTGYKRFPNVEAGEIAVSAVLEFLQEPSSVRQVVFNVYREYDLDIYRELLLTPELRERVRMAEG